VGVVLGSVLHLAVQLPGLWRRNPVYTVVLGLHHPGVRQVGRLMLPRMLGLAVVQLNFVVNTILASDLGLTPKIPLYLHINLELGKQTWTSQA